MTGAVDIPSKLRGEAVIAGAGDTAMGKLPGHGSLVLHALAARFALEDACLKARRRKSIISACLQQAELPL